MKALPLAAIASISGVTGFALAKQSDRIAEAVASRVRGSAEYAGFLAYLTAMNRRMPDREDRKLAAEACSQARYGWPGLYGFWSEREIEPERARVLSR